MHPLSNTREGMIQIPAAAANLTPGLLAKIDSNGKAALAGASYAPVAGRYVVVESDATTATLLPIEPGRQVRVTLYGDCNPGEELACTVDSKAVRKADTTGLSSILVAEEAGVDGQMVLARGIAAYVEPTPPDELPAIATGDAGKVLAVKTDESGVEFVTPSGSEPEIPAIASGDAGKVLAVKGDESGVEFVNPVGSSVPAPTTGDAKKILRVNAGEDSYELAGTYLDDAVLVLQGAAGGIVFGPVGSAPRMDNNGADLLIVQNIPTSDPSVAGALWNDGGTLKLSTGM
jgi:hypothetical protein